MEGVHDTGDPLGVVVAVLTYRRLERLSLLLPQLISQVGDVGRNSAFKTRILVIDNDPGATARTLVDGSHPLVHYVHEPAPGIAAARARAVAESNRADVLIFIDDDVEPSPAWLSQLLRTWLEHDRPAGVVGRVVPLYPDVVDPWITAGDFFTRRSYLTGTAVQAGSAANLLLDLGLLRRLDVTFDARLGLRGGEDTLLTRTVTARGYSLVWCDEAEVTGLIPPSRLTRHWVLRRAFNHGAVASRVDIVLSQRPGRTRASLLLGAFGRLLAGLTQAALGAATHRVSRHARGCKMLYRGAGLLAGAVGHDVVEYARRKS